MVQSGPMKNDHKHSTIVYQLVKIQLFAGLVATAFVAAHKHNLNTLFSGLVGLALAIAPTIVYTKIAFSSGFVSTPTVAYTRHKKAMISRFMLNLSLFSIVALVYRHCDYTALLIAYIVTLSGYWISLLLPSMR
jgi:hypothetical protein